MMGVTSVPMRSLAYVGSLRVRGRWCIGACTAIIVVIFILYYMHRSY